MQAAPAERPLPPVGIVFDCDMGSAIDDVLALAMLHGFSWKAEPEARLVSVSVTKSSLQSAAFCDAMALFYRRASFAALEEEGGPKLPSYLLRRRDLPIGLSDKGWLPEESPMLAAPLSRTDSDGRPLYPHEIENFNDTAQPGPLMRNAMTAQHDQNCVVVVTGPATNLAELLDVPDAMAIIEAKVRMLVMMGGAFPDGQPEFNIKADIGAARRVLADWPTPIVASGFEIGRDLLYPAESLESDCAWAPDHPVVDAYRASGSAVHDTPTWDLSAVLHAVRPEAGYFGRSDPGTIKLLDDGRTEFSPSQDGRHRYLVLDPARKPEILEAYREWVCARPDPPRRRR